MSAVLHMVLPSDAVCIRLVHFLWLAPLASCFSSGAHQPLSLYLGLTHWILPFAHSMGALTVLPGLLLLPFGFILCVISFDAK